MIRHSLTVLLTGVVLWGCAESGPDAATSPSTPSAGSSITPPAANAPAEQAPTGEAPVPGNGEAASTVPNGEGKITLSSANTKIEFVGVHEGDKPDPRRGGFGKFTGAATMAEGMLAGITVDIQTDSLTTEIDKLTEHLKSPDFFSVNDHPTAKFESTSIAMGEGGKAMVKGNLTLLGTTKEVEFPAAVSFADNGGLKLAADFTFDRTQYGMTFGQGKVKKDVQLIIKVGE